MPTIPYRQTVPRTVRQLLLSLLCLSITACSLSLHGRQTVQNGQSVTVVGSQIQGAAAVGSQGRVAFSAGSPPPAGASGGQLSLSRGAAALVIAGAIVSGMANAFAAALAPATVRPAGPGVPIAPTCSCFGQTGEAPAQ